MSKKGVFRKEILKKFQSFFELITKKYKTLINHFERFKKTKLIFELNTKNKEVNNNFRKILI